MASKDDRSDADRSRGWSFAVRRRPRFASRPLAIRRMFGMSWRSPKPSGAGCRSCRPGRRRGSTGARVLWRDHGLRTRHYSGPVPNDERRCCRIERSGDNLPAADPGCATSLAPDACHGAYTPKPRPGRRTHCVAGSSRRKDEFGSAVTAAIRAVRIAIVHARRTGAKTNGFARNGVRTNPCLSKLNPLRKASNASTARKQSD